MPISQPASVMISFVVPLYNEQPALEQLYRQLHEAADKLRESYEIIFVDDGSTDGCGEILRKLHFEDEHVKVITLSRNFGKHEAMAAGCDFAAGQAVVTLDADCQHPPELVSTMVQKWRQGFEVVYTIRTNADVLPFWKRWTGRLFYRWLKRLTRMDITAKGDFLLMDRKVVCALRQMREKTRFTRGLIEWLGFKQVGFEYQAAARAGGQSGYSFGKLLKTASAAIFNFSVLPLRLIGLSGLALTAAAMVYAVSALVLWRLIGASLVANLVAAGVGMLGVQLAMLGILGEYIGRTYEEAKGRPLYVIRETVGFDVAEDDDMAQAPATRTIRAGPSRIRFFT